MLDINFHAIFLFIVLSSMFLILYFRQGTSFSTLIFFLIASIGLSLPALIIGVKFTKLLELSGVGFHPGIFVDILQNSVSALVMFIIFAIGCKLLRVKVHLMALFTIPFFVLNLWLYLAYLA